MRRKRGAGRGPASYRLEAIQTAAFFLSSNHGRFIPLRFAIESASFNCFSVGGVLFVFLRFGFAPLFLQTLRLWGDVRTVIMLHPYIPLGFDMMLFRLLRRFFIEYGRFFDAMRCKRE